MGVSLGINRARTARKLGVLLSASLLASAGLVVGSGASLKPKASPISVTIATPPAAIPDAPLYVGLAKGIFAKYGLNVTVTALSGSSVVATAIATGSVHFAAVSSFNVLQGQSSGVPIESISTFDNGLALAAFVSSSYAAAHNITSKTPVGTAVQALVGSRLGVSSSTIAGQADVLLRSYGIQPSQVTQVTVSSPAAAATAIQKNQIDWLMNSEPVPLQLQSQGYGFEIATDRNAPAFEVNQLNLVLATNPSFADANPGLTKKVVAAVDASVAYLGEHEQASLSSLEPYFPGVSRVILLKGLQRLHWPKTGFQSAGIWRSTVAFNIKSGLIPHGSGNIAKEGVVYTNKFVKTKS